MNDSELSELEKLKIENHKLKSAVHLLQQQIARITQQQLLAERALLEQQFGSDIFK